VPRSWTEGLLSALWNCSHDLWLHRNELRHGATTMDQAAKSRARLEALIVDRCTHRPHLDDRHHWLFGVPLETRLKEGNRSLQIWLTSVSNLSSITTGFVQTDLRRHATHQRLTEGALGRLRRPKRRLRRRSPTISPPTFSKFVLGTTRPSSSQLLTNMWNLTLSSQPTPLKRKPRKPRCRKQSHSTQAYKIFDRGRNVRNSYSLIVI